MFRRILVPLDGSETSAAALAVAIDIARSSRGRLRLVHQVEDRSHLAACDPSGSSAGELFKVMRAGGLQLLAAGTTVARSAEIEADELLIDGLARLGEAVAQAAKLWDADLIVVGTHGRRGAARALLGSGAEQIIRLARVPVLTVRGPDGAGGPPTGDVDFKARGDEAPVADRH